MDLLQLIAQDKTGLEIGGPSSTGKHFYHSCRTMDNVIFSKHTAWCHHTDEYKFHPYKSGKVLVLDAVDLSSIETQSYDFVFSSHCLEHIANPLKAIKEWLRVIRNNGYLVLIVPEKSVCFDHKRDHTTFQTLFQQYEKNVGEDDLSTLPEILEKHDLTMDLPAGNLEQFTRRSKLNYDNRCLHHYVYSPELLHEICKFVKGEFVLTHTEGINIWFILKKRAAYTIYRDNQFKMK
jgi:predicted SAM-dependent methyltransferase